jgi:hypothetical protein
MEPDRNSVKSKTALEYRVMREINRNVPIMKTNSETFIRMAKQINTLPYHDVHTL